MEYSDLLVFHGPISKEKCQELLSAKGKNGSFLIRESETIHGALCLCVYQNKTVYTYRILQTHSGYYTLQAGAGVKEVFFKTLKDLIEHYKKKNQGLISRLRHSVNRKQSMAEYVDSDDTHDYENTLESEYVEVLPD